MGLCNRKRIRSGHEAEINQKGRVMYEKEKEKFVLSIRNELRSDQELFVVWMWEPLSRERGMFSIAPYGVYLVDAFIKGATHRQ